MRKPGVYFVAAAILLMIGLARAFVDGTAKKIGSGEEKPAGRLDIEAEDLAPGLLGHYRSLENKEATFIRVDAKPAFYLGQSSPHPRLPPGPFEVAWTGVIILKDAGTISFHAFLGGELTMEVDGVGVLQGTGTFDSAQINGKRDIERKPGVYRLKIHYRSLEKVPARLQIWWQGQSFSGEPLPAWNLGRLSKEDSPAARAEALAGQGRLLAGQLGCARCHKSAFPGVSEPPPGPALADVRGRIDRDWLLRWLEDPAKVHGDARMPALFKADRTGFVERWIVADSLVGNKEKSAAPEAQGDHRQGRLAFIGSGCAACHQVPDIPRMEQVDLERYPLRGLGDRLKPDQLAAFLANPHARYPDGRMPRLPMAPKMARDLSAYLLTYSRTNDKVPAIVAPTANEIAAVIRGLKAPNQLAAATALIREKKCAECHPGIGSSVPADIPTAKRDGGCMAGTTLPRFALDESKREALRAYLKVAGRERFPSPFEDRQRHLARAGCVRCHQRDSERPPPIEVAGSTLGGGYLQEIPFQRTPRLTYPHQKFIRSHLVETVREGVSGLRPTRYTYRMPAFGQDAETLVQALAEADGELSAGPQPHKTPTANDPTLGPLSGSLLAGFQGYACISCHIWNGQAFSQPDPGAIGTDLTRLTGRIRRNWFDRFLEGPGRFHPGTPMPAIFFKGKPATLGSILDGDPVKQKEALWSYFALGKNAPQPKPPPPLAVTAPAIGEPPLVAQIPMHPPTGKAVESISLLFSSHDLLIYNLGSGTLHSFYTGGQILRDVQGRLRSFSASGTPVVAGFDASPAFQLAGANQVETPKALLLEGYDLLKDGARIRSRLVFPSRTLAMVEEWRLVQNGAKRTLLREMKIADMGRNQNLEVNNAGSGFMGVEVLAVSGSAKGAVNGKAFRAILTSNNDGKAVATIRFDLPAARPAPTLQYATFSESARIEGSLERPGYRAIAYPRPKTASGEDLIMPGALAVDPRGGRVFVASMKMGEIFVVHDPDGTGKNARFQNYAGGLFQEAFGMLAEKEALYVLHRRNLSKLIDTRGGGFADRIDRVASLPHGVADTYDYGYGLARDKTGGFVFSYAPYANRHLPGSGGALSLVPGKEPREIAFGFRNPFGWCAGPEREIFFTDNQGEWVATNKLSHMVAGRYYGFPNPLQQQHLRKPAGKAAVWVPYSWARSINGVAHDDTGGKFGPFAGQLFMAELMFGGAIIRANLEKVNGEYQGACFPFWGKGLLGPLTLAFDPRGRLYVGGITEPGWMAQPDRGALFRIDFTGQVPFEMQSIHALPRGFRINFTAPVSAETAGKLASYHIEHYRYEFTGAYGSPELERAKLSIEKVQLATDQRSVELTTAPLIAGRIYMIAASGVRSAKGDALVHPMGAYTLNQVPGSKK